MSYENRLKLIEQIENLRQAKLIAFLTSLRPGLPAQIGDDSVRVFFDHLLLLPERPIKKLDIFLVSNGGSGTVPWRLVSLFREFAETFSVLIPYRAYSAATLLALGANEIVMHPFGEMGPIDPKVANEFNPINPQTQQLIGVSVEDVKAYVTFIKETVGIKHEDELVKTIEILAQKLHPLALGNVERFISQNRMIARKILMTHMEGDQNAHKIDEIIENLASKLYFHGHPINRREAKTELGLKIAENVPPALETAMWDLYCDFEDDFKNREVYDPLAEIWRAADAVAPQPQPGQPLMIPIGTRAELDLCLARIESARRTSAFSIRRRWVVAGTGPQLEPVIREETLSQRWDHQQAQ